MTICEVIIIYEIDWFCDFLGIKLSWYQKIILELTCLDAIKSMMNRIKYGQGKYQTFRINDDGDVDSHIYSGDVFDRIFTEPTYKQRIKNKSS